LAEAPDRARTTFDTTEVHAHVNAKYDTWQRDILSRFGVKLGNMTKKKMHSSIPKARK